MTQIPYYQIDAFTDKPFSGNPAAVCPLSAWLSDELMQAMAAEHNLSETAFLVPEGDGYAIRWFTPEVEVDLCGHATLASGYVIFHELGFSGDHVALRSPRSGPLAVSRHGDWLRLDFPADASLKQLERMDGLAESLGLVPLEIYRGKTDVLVILDDEYAVKTLQPDLQALNQIDARGVIVSAPGNEVDFVSRFFAPQAGVPEDPVTGSAHTTLTPYWSRRLGKTELRARQVSARGGELRCTLREERVEIAGQACLYSRGQVLIG